MTKREGQPGSGVEVARTNLRAEHDDAGRAEKLNEILIDQKREKIGRISVDIDINGLLIQIDGAYHHLPYHLLRPEAFDALLSGNWFEANSPSAQELRARFLSESRFLADSESKTVDLATARAEQLASFFEKITNSLSPKPKEVRDLADNFLSNPERVAELVTEQGLFLPDALIEQVLARGHEGVFAVVRFGEAVGAELTDEPLTRQLKKFVSYELLHEAALAYDARRSVLNDPKYYNAGKVVRAVLKQGAKSDPDGQFAVFCGKFKRSARSDKNKGEQHSFLEVVHSGRTARLLLNEGKHLGTDEYKKALRALPQLERAEYEKIESALSSFDFFLATAQNLEKALQTPGKKTKPERLKALAEAALGFLLNNFTAYYTKAKNIYRRLDGANHADVSSDWLALAGIFKEAGDAYKMEIYRNLGEPGKFIEKFIPGLKTLEVAFGPEFLAGATEQCCADGYDENLSLNSPAVRAVIVEMKVDELSGTVPYETEEACLEKIRLTRGRPLINVVGGARFATAEKMAGDVNPLDAYSAAVLAAAHKHRANVWVPGTQSGVGTAFGRQNAFYKSAYAHLPRAEQAHVFSIVPGKSVYYPENSLLSGVNKDEVFALTPVDTIVTPFSAGWELKGREKLHSPYQQHIDHMESLYERAAGDAPKVIVAGNGGFYSILEINASLDRGFSLILIGDSGRFAEISALIMPSIDEIDLSDTERTTEMVLKIARMAGGEKKEVVAEFLRKDFGADLTTDNEDYQVYRDMFREFLRRAKKYKNKIVVSAFATLENDLDNEVTRQSKKK